MIFMAIMMLNKIMKVKKLQMSTSRNTIKSISRKSLLTALNMPKTCAHRFLYQYCECLWPVEVDFDTVMPFILKEFDSDADGLLNKTEFNKFMTAMVISGNANANEADLQQQIAARWRPMCQESTWNVSKLSKAHGMMIEISK